MAHVYKIVPADLWAAAEAAGRFDGAPVDTADGFIHLSDETQVRETAALHFAGQDDLLLVTLEADDLGPALRWEPSRAGALFPHLYAPLELAFVRRVVPIPTRAGGDPDLSGLLP